MIAIDALEREYIRVFSIYKTISLGQEGLDIR